MGDKSHQDYIIDSAQFVSGAVVIIW